MVFKRMVRPGIVGALLMLGAASAPAQRGPAPGALGTLERGEWQLKDGEGEVRKLCLRNPGTLLQIMHGDAQCEHFVMESAKSSATIRYTCPSHGHGRTTISIDTPRVINIDTQGVANGAPFAEKFEGRRIGACN